MLTNDQIDRGRDLLLDGDFRAGLEGAIAQAVDRIIVDWTADNPVAACHALQLLLDQAAGRLTAKVLDDVDVLGPFVGAGLCSSRPMLRELIELADAAEAAAAPTA